MISQKKILLGVTGSIAAYKSAMLLRLLIKAGAEVKVVMTPAARGFIAPLTLSTLSKSPVFSEFTSDDTSGRWNNHVELGLWADALVIAPASANTISKMAHGLCDNFLTAVYLSAKCPVFIAPAMDLDMHKHKTTQENIKRLQSIGNILIHPGNGELASGLYGEGRMEEPEIIFDLLAKHFSESAPLKNKKILITAGPTFEPIDPVRFIGNHSSGKMGFALAEEAAGMGAEVTLITGPVSLELSNKAGIKRINVTTSDEMQEKTVQHFASSDIAIMSAAVADFKPAVTEKSKIKKGNYNVASVLKLIPTTDILSELGKIKTKRQLLAGFALETENEFANAKKKMKTKKLDFIVLNSLKDAGAGFGHDTNKITIIDRHNKTEKFELKSKREAAKDILRKVCEVLKHNIL